MQKWLEYLIIELRVIECSKSLLLSGLDINMFLDLIRFSSIGGKNCSPTLIAPIKKVQELGKNSEILGVVTFHSKLIIKHEYSHWKGNPNENRYGNLLI